MLKRGQNEVICYFWREFSFETNYSWKTKKQILSILILSWENKGAPFPLPFRQTNLFIKFDWSTETQSTIN